MELHRVSFDGLFAGWGKLSLGVFSTTIPVVPVTEIFRAKQFWKKVLGQARSKVTRAFGVGLYRCQ